MIKEIKKDREKPSANLPEREAADHAPVVSDTPPEHPPESKPPKRKRSRWRIAGITLLVIIVIGTCLRLMLPWGVRWYVNRTLDQNLLYEGKIGNVSISLWRGAYSISDIRLIQKTGNVPTPLFRADRLELAIQWNAILHGKVVGQVIMENPEINFVAPSDDSESQTGAGGPWLQTLTDLFPFKLNSMQIHNGSVHFRSYKNQNQWMSI